MITNIFQIFTALIALGAFESFAQPQHEVPLARSSARDRAAGIKPGNCDISELRKVRKEIDRLVKDSMFDGALKRAEEFDENCWSSLITAKTKLKPNEIEDYYWMQSGVMVAASKLGRTDKCIKIGLESTNGFYGNLFTEYSLESKSVGKAIRHNLELCSRNRDQAYPSESVRPCPESLAEGSLKAWQLPSQWQAQLGATCIRLEPHFTGTKDQMEAEDPDLKLCPGIRLVDTRQKSIAKWEPTVAKNGSLSKCELCGYDRLSISSTDKGHFLRIRGDLSYCTGGTGSVNYDGVYEIRGRDLFLVNEMVAALH